MVRNKGICFYLNIGTFIATLAAFILYFVIYLPEAGAKDIIAVFLFLTSLVLEIALFIWKTEGSMWLEILLTFICTLTPMRIITSNIVIMSFVDLANSIDYFGNVDLIPRMLIVTLLCLMAVLLSIASSFGSREK